MKQRRPGVPTKMRPAVWDRTQGHCHFCGDFHERDGDWESDHVRQLSRVEDKKEYNHILNLLLICRKCNGGTGRWNREGTEVRELFRLGILMRDLIAGKSKLGKFKHAKELNEFAERDVAEKVKRAANEKAKKLEAQALGGALPEDQTNNLDADAP